MPGRHFFLNALLTAVLLISRGAAAERLAISSATPAAVASRPFAIESLSDDRLLVAYQTGVISLIDPQSHAIVSTQVIGKQLTALHVHHDGTQSPLVLMTEGHDHELIAFRREGDRLTTVSRAPLAHYPSAVTMNDRGQVLTASLWSRRFQVFRFRKERLVQLRLESKLDLPFAAADVLAIPRTDLAIISDAFGGRIAVVDTQRQRLLAVHSTGLHNLADLQFDADNGRVTFAAQRLNPDAHTTVAAIGAGRLIQNLLCNIPLKALTQTDALPADAVTSLKLGIEDCGAADPVRVLALPNDMKAVCLAAGNEVLFVDGKGTDVGRVIVGARPVDMTTSADGKRLFVANLLSDSVSVVDVPTQKVVATIRPKNTPPDTSTRRGERMFFSSAHAFGGWLSCASCHSRGQSNNGLADTFSDGSFGTPKRVLSLGGVSNTNDWAWNGSIRELSQQMHKSVETSMRGESITPQQANDLVMFLFSLEPPPSLLLAREQLTDPRVAKDVARGQRVFTRYGCGNCHVPPLTYTIDAVFDVGLRDEAGLKKFNPPSLRGVSQRDSFFHDGRAASLEEVLNDWQHQLPADTTPAELRQLVVFLKSL